MLGGLLTFGLDIQSLTLATLPHGGLHGFGGSAGRLLDIDQVFMFL